jgi:hypothetical protein
MQMKIHGLIVLGAVSLGGLSLSVPAQAHDCCRGHAGCPAMSDQAPGPKEGAPASKESFGGRGTGRMYDPDTVTTLRGVANAVTVVPARGGRQGGTHVTLQSDGQAMDIHLGPTWFLQREGFEIAKGDSIEVTGSVVDSDGATFLIAREVKKGQKSVKLRDEQGVPAWSGGRRP